ncbi:MAG: hypothetical protein J2P27_10810 [Actinobacteria bacterium]|nr:hypothetical protein [Actinomycetota bacterium]
MLAAAVVVILGVTIFLILRPQRPERLTGCEAGPDGQGFQLSTGQAAIAATIAGVANKRHLPARAVAVAYAAALQESKLTNLPYGDLDSVGVFQQRPSEGWGSAHQLQNPIYATGRFFDALTAVSGYQKLPIDVAAQDVQHSADGTAYAQYAPAASAMASAFTGTVPHAVWCSYADPPGKPHLAAASRGLNSAFGLQARPGSAPRFLAIPVTGNPQGWAVAAWLVAHADTYGITSVRYDGYQWRGFTGLGHWTRPPPRASAPATAASVEFG